MIYFITFVARCQEVNFTKLHNDFCAYLHSQNALKKSFHFVQLFNRKCLTYRNGYGNI